MTLSEGADPIPFKNSTEEITSLDNFLSAVEDLTFIVLIETIYGNRHLSSAFYRHNEPLRHPMQFDTALG